MWPATLQAAEPSWFDPRMGRLFLAEVLTLGGRASVAVVRYNRPYLPNIPLRFTMSLRLVAVVALFTALPAFADEASDKLKKLAAANLAKAEVMKTATVETDHLIVCSTLPEAKTKTLADALQKTHALGRKVLQFEEKDDIWKGKLTVYYLPETKAFKSFIRSVDVDPKWASPFRVCRRAPTKVLLVRPVSRACAGRRRVRSASLLVPAAGWLWPLG